IDGIDLTGEIAITAQRLDQGLLKLRIRATNTTAMSAASIDAALCAFHSAHISATVSAGRFVSLTDPPADLAEGVSGCKNVGVWPVLVGNPGIAQTILASPIVLPDYPAIAPESPGDLHDSSEIDEILTLRILTMTDEEKDSARKSGDRAR